MDENGVITMTNADGTSYTADIGNLIKTYNFVDSDQIDFTATLQEDGSYNVTGTIKGGSITDAMIESGYLANVTAQASSANTSSQNATAKATLAESYAKGGTNTRTGEDTDNAKYYSDRASALVDVDIATTTKAGIVKPDGTTITVDADGTIHSPGGHTHANKTTLDSITEEDLINWNAKADIDDIPVIATTSVPGTVKPDDTTIKVDANGVITATAQTPDIATPLVAGIVKFDDETIGMDENNALYVIGGGQASGVLYSNTASELGATNVQDAIDEVNNSLAGCYISFTDEQGNPTTEPYIHWNTEV